MGTVAPLLVATPRRLASDPVAWLRALLLVAVSLAVVALPLVGFKQVAYYDLIDDLKQGRTDTVTVHNALPGDATGYSVVTLEWRVGGVLHRAEVMNVRSAPGAPQPPISPGTSARLHGPIAPHLVRESSGAPLTVTAESRVPSVAMELPFGWSVDGAARALYAMPTLLAVGLLALGPQPWRATRWAWFWMVVSPLGFLAIPAFCVLSGPTAGVPAPRTIRRLTGAWSLVLSLVAAALALQFVDWVGIVAG